MLIPRSFALANREYSVSRVEMDTGLYGNCDYAAARINLSTAIEDRTLLEHTFLHELVHAALNALGRAELNSDEGFVDALAGLLHQALQTQHGRVS